jgi:phosphoglycolate phosphatase
MKRLLIVLDFDGLLLNSYGLIERTFQDLDLDVGDETRFRNRRKFLKYFGGGRELLGNMAIFALPKKKCLRERLTENYTNFGRVFDVFVPFFNACIDAPEIHIGVVSRNFTLHPGRTIRKVLENSGVDHPGLDFVIPLPVGVKKTSVLEAMRTHRYRDCVLAGDEVGDYMAAVAAGYTPVIASYGFDDSQRLADRTGMPLSALFANPEDLAMHLLRLSEPYRAVPVSEGAGESVSFRETRQPDVPLPSIHPGSEISAAPYGAGAIDSFVTPGP